MTAFDPTRPHGKRTVRRLSDLRSYFADPKAADAILSREDPAVYEVCAHPVPPGGEHLDVSTTTLFPGKVGREYYFTRGHFHRDPDVAEVAIGIAGEGTFILQSRRGEVRTHPLKPSAVLYIEPGWAHRAVNTSDRPFVFVSVSRADVGHDYDAIAAAGFARRLFG